MKKTSRQFSARLQHKITFIENINKNETDNEQWQEVLTTFAEIVPISENRFVALESMDFGHIITEAICIFKLRFVTGIGIKMRIIFGQKNFEIKRIINLKEQNRLLQIIALEI